MSRLPEQPVLVINLGWEQEPLVRRLLERGCRVVGIHHDAATVPDLPLQDVHIADYRDLQAILSIADAVRPSAVIADQCDYSYFAVASVAERRGLPGARVREAQLATNKYLQRMRGEAAGLLQPKFRLVASVEDARQAVAELGFPAIVKPVDNRGSFGVNRVDSESELASAYFDALVNAHSRLVLVEEFVAGTHITIDGYCFPRLGHRSLSLATKGMLGGARQVAIDIIYPGELPADVYARAWENNEKVVRALGYRFGMTHAEYMITPDGRPYLIEIANRGGGCFTSAKIVPAVSGIDVTEQLIIDSLGEDLDLFEEKGVADQYSAYLKFFVFRPGRIRAYPNLQEVTGLDGVDALRIRIPAGGQVAETTTDGDRHGFVITRGATRDESRRRANDVIARLRVEYV